MFNNKTNNKTKLTKILYLDKKKSIQQVLFHLIRSTGSIKTFKLCSIKNDLDKFMRKKEHFVKYFVVCEIF